jgi:uncharacterized protein (UPF0303 family)
MSERMDALLAEEQELVLDRFEQSDAWRLGSILGGLAVERQLRVGIDIRRPGIVLFRTMLGGVTPDQEVWIARKSATVLRMEQSGALVEERFRSYGIDPATGGWLDDTHVVTAGSFPIRVRGVGGVVAAVTASGLSSQEDHDLVVEGLRILLAEQRAA